MLAPLAPTHNEWGSWTESISSISLKVRLKESDQPTATVTVTLHRERSEPPPGLWRSPSRAEPTPPICSEFCCTVTLSPQCNISEPTNRRTTRQRVVTHQSLCLFFFLSLSTYSLMFSLFLCMLTAKLVGLFPALVLLCVSKVQTWLLMMMNLTLLLFLGVPPCCGGAVRHHASLSGVPPGFPHWYIC